MAGVMKKYLSRSFFRFLGIGLAACAGAAPCRADILILDNGVRMIGAVELVDGGYRITTRSGTMATTVAAVVIKMGLSRTAAACSMAAARP